MYLQFILFASFFILVLDWYYYRSVKNFTKNYSTNLRATLRISYWIFTFLVITFLIFITTYFINKTAIPKFARTYMMGFIFMVVVSKVIGIVFLMLYDVQSLTLFIKKNIIKKFYPKKIEKSIGRRSFLKKSVIIASAIPFGTLLFGMVNSAFDFTIRKQKLRLKNLPSAFKGLKIIQISDIHTGSFMTNTPLEEAVQLINKEQPDVVFFTGDLVNDISEEALPFIDTLKKINAPLGVFSILGNHDYGDYFYQSDDVEGKQHNLHLMKEIHEKLGWKLLNNEHHILEIDNQRLAIIGVENWGHGHRFPKYGNLEKAKKGCLEEDVKLLLSHDPSHWDAQILKEHKDIAVTFSGHTHGMQFGIEIPGFKWSPSEYLYPQWAGLYKKNEQQIYVNRGLGFLGYPGRVGILPEITVFELG
ncbi:MAG: metallophosphoesterase [Vicingaceae bacterium]|nr:metallophosphoesterase [Vicingaceae bacterium]